MAFLAGASAYSSEPTLVVIDSLSTRKSTEFFYNLKVLEHALAARQAYDEKPWALGRESSASNWSSQSNYVTRKKYWPLLIEDCPGFKPGTSPARFIEP